MLHLRWRKHLTSVYIIFNGNEKELGLSLFGNQLNKAWTTSLSNYTSSIYVLFNLFVFVLFVYVWV